MASQLLRDARIHPHLFDLKLPAASDEIEAIEHRLRAALPPSYQKVLGALGQGSFFDSETLLGVHEIDEGIGDIDQINRELHDKQGLADSLVVFHIGLGGMHAFDTETTGPEYEVVQLDEDSLERGEVYTDFDDWYEAGIRPEYESLLDADED